MREKINLILKYEIIIVLLISISSAFTYFYVIWFYKDFNILMKSSFELINILNPTIIKNYNNQNQIIAFYLIKKFAIFSFIALNILLTINLFVKNYNIKLLSISLLLITLISSFNYVIQTNMIESEIIYNNKLIKNHIEKKCLFNTGCKNLLINIPTQESHENFKNIELNIFSLNQEIDKLLEITSQSATQYNKLNDGDVILQKIKNPIVLYNKGNVALVIESNSYIKYKIIKKDFCSNFVIGILDKNNKFISDDMIFKKLTNESSLYQTYKNKNQINNIVSQLFTKDIKCE